MSNAMTFHLRGDPRGVETAVKRAKTAIGGFGSKIRGFGAILSAISAKISQFQTNMLAFVSIRKVFEGFKVATSQFASFEEGMLKIQAVMGITATQTKDLEGVIEHYGKATEFSLNAIQKTVYDLATQGYSTDNIKDLLGTITQLAVAGDVDLPEAAKTLTAKMSIFGDSMKDAAKSGNVMINAMVKSKVSVMDIGQALPYVGSLAKMFNRKLEDVLPVLMALRAAGMPVEMAAAGMLTAFQGLLKPTGQMKQVLKEMGLELKDVNVDVQNFDGVLANLAKANMTATQAAILFGRQSKVIIAAMNASSETVGKKGIPLLKHYRKELNEQGKMAKVAALKQRGLSFAFKQVSASWDILVNNIGAKISEFFNLEQNTLGLNTALGNMAELIKNLNFGKVGEGAAAIFDPSEIAKNIGAALDHVVPAAIELFGAAGAYGALSLAESLVAQLPSIIRFLNKGFIRVVGGGARLFVNIITEGIRFTLTSIPAFLNQIIGSMMFDVGKMISKMPGFGGIGRSIALEGKQRKGLTAKDFEGMFDFKMLDQAGETAKKLIRESEDALIGWSDKQIPDKAYQSLAEEIGKAKERIKVGQKWAEFIESTTKVPTEAQKAAAKSIVDEMYRAINAEATKRGADPQSKAPANEVKVDNRNQTHHNYRQKNRNDMLRKKQTTTPRGDKT